MTESKKVGLFLNCSFQGPRISQYSFIYLFIESMAVRVAPWLLQVVITFFDNTATKLNTVFTDYLAQGENLYEEKG